jgi:hypothetical protein
MSDTAENLSMVSKAFKTFIETTLQQSLINEIHEMRAELERARKFITTIRMVDPGELDEILGKFCRKCNQHIVKDSMQCDLCYIFDCPSCDIGTIGNGVKITSCGICDYCLCAYCITNYRNFEKCAQCDEYLCDDECREDHAINFH